MRPPRGRPIATGHGAAGSEVARQVICAPNAFKGALGSVEAAGAMAAGVREAGLPGVEPVEVPVADGGDGTLDVLLGAFPGSWVHGLAVRGPLGASVQARLGWLDARTAVVEMAEAAGLRLLPPRDRDALRASTAGVGELIRAALDGGATRIVVGVGGSASSDGGAGALVALGARLLDGRGAELESLGGGALPSLARLDVGGLDPRLRRCHIEVAVDVRSPLLGPRGAAAVFGPQKGASPADVARLDAGLAVFARVVAETLGVDAQRAGEPGMGAAGGCAFGLAVVCGAVLLRGAALVCDLVGLDASLRGAALALTGEGRLDASTAEGKAPAEVARRAAAAGVACVALTGAVEQPLAPAYSEALAIGAGLTSAASVRRTAELLRTATAAVVRRRLGAG